LGGILQIGIAIVKSVSFRGAVQEFTNVYHYASTQVNLDNSGGLGLIDELVANEKTFHSSAVSFVRARCWSSGGTPAQNTMIAEKLLTGVGSLAVAAYMDRERAFLILWPAGVDSRGKQVNLKKWYHSVGFIAAASIANTQTKLENTSAFTAAEKTAVQNVVDAVTLIGNLEGWSLVAESGRVRDGGGPIAHDYLEHHQLGDMWR
jgi:hypothetical protein